MKWFLLIIGYIHLSVDALRHRKHHLIDDSYVNGVIYKGRITPTDNLSDSVYYFCQTDDKIPDEDDGLLVPRNFLDQNLTLCHPQYCVLIEGEKRRGKVGIAGYLVETSFDLVLPETIYDQLFEEYPEFGELPSGGRATWRFVEC